MPRSAGGFSLVELMVVVTIISIMMMMAVPTYDRIRRKARATAIANDFRVYAAAFQAHAHAAGSWPDDTPAGGIPPGMTADELNLNQWTATTSIGGKFKWERHLLINGTQYNAALSIASTADTSPLNDADLMEQLDRELDDGNLSQGNFQIGDDYSPVYIIER
jgi:prepilin-type N-terminal cleavage/methylation domain-containing protein